MSGVQADIRIFDMIGLIIEDDKLSRGQMAEKLIGFYASLDARGRYQFVPALITKTVFLSAKKAAK